VLFALNPRDKHHKHALKLLSELREKGEIEEKYDISFFDSLIVASALRLDLGILSDDRAFDRIPGIVRTPMS
jgi:predicted nucleic acid-binding protein